jgi:predicted ABC-type transport system involved in lysophospholipase L1 biosynthesis ATPase subunit
MVSHDRTLAERVDRVLNLEDGIIINDGGDPK